MQKHSTRTQLRQSTDENISKKKVSYFSPDFIHLTAKYTLSQVYFRKFNNFYKNT